ncbi:protein-glutamate O-methyltransferase [uncultured Psychromonas sp.]|uniref:CheR family methyltransferase n=1 Tax=uncultured Psychromonas sp. TaxID=173974 RepID=UPI00262225C8|nr:protein-glutamate O-methyltransferase [uncultured Psychromonas sp.]
MRIFSDDLYKKFASFLEKQCGIVLGENKQYLVKSRLTPLVSQFDFPSLPDLIEKVITGHNNQLRNSVVDAMTTNETLWFRDVYPFELLTTKLFPEFLKTKRNLKVWSAASSSGQEAYSIAMCAIEYDKIKPMNNLNIKITGTDISDSMLNQCNLGQYDSLALSRGLSEGRKRQFFIPVDGLMNKMQVKPEVKKLTSFKRLNLLDSYAGLGKFDLIFCRNVLIYFSNDVKSQILNQFANALNPDGYLILGASESLNGLTDKFEMVRCNPGIIYKLKAK